MDNRSPNQGLASQLVRDPDWIHGYLERAARAVERGERDACLRDLARGLVLDPTDSRARNLILGASTMTGWQLDHTFIANLKRSLVAEPASRFALTRGVVVLKLHERGLPFARKLAERSITAHPANSLLREQAWKLKSDWGWGGRGIVGDVTMGHGAKETSPRFFRTARMRWFPHTIDAIDDLDRVLSEDIFHAHLPKTPPIADGGSIIAMGSCFAQHIRQHLRRQGQLAEHVVVPRKLVSELVV